MNEIASRVLEGHVASGARVIRWLEDGDTVSFGDVTMDVVHCPGHTPGHMAVAVASSGEKLLYISDAALHAIHLEQPGWYAAVDVAPKQARASRRRLAERAAAERALIQAFHFPFPGLRIHNY